MKENNASNLSVNLERAAHLIRNSNFLLAFTGAGVSTGSGIPDFRGPSGLWKKWQPVYYQDFLSSHSARVEHWEFKLAGWNDFRAAKPNKAHLALAELEHRGKLQLLVTQNIDGLHGLAGNSADRIVELHGTNLRIVCVECGKTCEPNPVYEEFKETRIPPVCDCGGFLKPATISFGQQMPLDLLAKAFDAASRTDVVVSIGSTLEVEPAATVPLQARQNGATYIIINRGQTAHDACCDVRLEGDASILVPRVVELALSANPGSLCV